MALSKTVRRYILGALERVAPIVPDKMYLHIKYYCRMGKKLNLKNPQTFNEKLQWLKLYGRRPLDTVLSDKYAVKEYISQTIGPEYVIPLIGVWGKFDDIDFDKLPNQFVLKCTHDSGGLVICKDKSKLDLEAARKKINKCLKHDFYVYSREKAYKDIPRRIIAEEYMEDSQTCELRDYKVHCFNGEPKFVLVCQNRYTDSGLTEDFYTTDWQLMPVCRPNHPNSKIPVAKPKELGRILEFSKTLSKDIPFVRADFYIINHRVYFGEMTFSPAAGMTPFVPDSYDKLLGDWI